MHHLFRFARFRVGLASVLLLGFVTLAANAHHRTNFEQLDRYFSSALKQWHVPGMAIAVVKDNEVVFARGYGDRHTSRGGRVDEHTLFAIASNSKAFTAAALAILVDENKLHWDDRVTRYLPYFQLYDPYVAHEMRVRDLLCHRSGLGRFSGDLLWYGTNYTAEEVIRRARYLPPASSFRAKYGYSNLMFISAGEIVPAITGKTWSAFVKERIFDKLGMDNTVISVSSLSGKENVATPHREADGKTVALDWVGWDNMAAAGGIISSVSDMSKWIELQLNRGHIGEVTIFSTEASRTMWSPHTIVPISETSRKIYPSTHFKAYGLGWAMMDYLGRKVLTHGGGYDGMFSRVALVPEENLGMVILTNGMTNLQTALVYKILDAYLGGDERDWSAELLELARKNKSKTAERRAQAARNRVRETKPALPLESYAGTYGGEMYGDAEVTLENGSLVLHLLPNPDLTGDLSHWHFDTFVVNWRKQFAWFDEGTVQFLLDADGQVAEMKIDVPNQDFWFTELEFKRKEQRK
ncbi:MAG: serine hydrolase [bacterium]